MCIVFFFDAEESEEASPYRFVLASNRDEVLSRPAAPAQPLACDGGSFVDFGVETKAGGLWLTVQMKGRSFEKLGVITNVRESLEETIKYGNIQSRGNILKDFASSETSATAFSRGIQNDLYAGFNLLLADSTGATFCSNRGSSRPDSASGCIAFSNETMPPSAPWPKVRRGRAQFEHIVRQSARENDDDDALVARLMDMLRDATPSLESLPGILPRDFEESLSSIRVLPCRTPIDNLEYATRTNTVVLVKTNGEVTFAEANVRDGGASWELKTHRLHELPPPFVENKRIHPLFAAKRPARAPAEKRRKKSNLSANEAVKRVRTSGG